MKTNNSQTPELADILRSHWDAYCAGNPVNAQQKKVARAIMACRTPLLDGFIEECDHCHVLSVVWHSCRDRHCPKCQYPRALKWIEKRLQELLPVPYFHVVFTLPDVLRSLCLANQKSTYNLLLKCVQQTVLEITKDSNHLGAVPGGIAVLHTWTQTMEYHPHVHCIITGGGLSDDLNQWISSRSDQFLVSINVLAALFRGKFLANLKEIPEIHENSEYQHAIQSAYKINWNVFSKAPFAGAESVLSYLGRYTHRVAISNSRILSCDGNNVIFRYKDRRDGNIEKLMTLPVFEFIRRFFMHVLPFNQVKIRQFGLLANRKKAEMIECVRKILKTGVEFLLELGLKNALTSELPAAMLKCPYCQIGHMKKINVRVPKNTQWKGS